MEVTTLSTKGQIVIPEKIRHNFKTGSAFVVAKVNEMIVLKPVPHITDEEKNELKELKSIWNDIDNGKADAYSEKEFFSAMKQW
jgi:AbrB family looped-hinge helix DNA binding protein